METTKVEVWEKYPKKIVDETDIGTFISKYGHMHFLTDYIPPNSTVLDIGCGTGSFLGKLKKGKNCTVVGIDFIKDSLAIAREQNAIDGIVADCNRLSIKKGKFDVIVSLGLFEHFQSPEKLLNEWDSALKHGGLHICAVPNKYGFFGISALNKFYYEFRHGEWKWGWEYRYTPKELVGIFENGGYDIKHVLTSKIVPPFWFRTGLSKYPKKLRKRILSFYELIERKLMRYPFGYHLIIIARKK